MQRLLGWCALTMCLLNVVALARRVYPLSPRPALSVAIAAVAALLALGVRHYRRPLSQRASLALVVAGVVVIFVSRWLLGGVP